MAAQPRRIAYCAGEGVSGLPARFGAAAEPYQAFDLPGFTFFKTIPQLFEDGIEVGDVVRVGKKAAGRLLDGKEWRMAPGETYA